MKYIKQLDSIRAIALMLVVTGHWIPAEKWINRIPNGPIGVNTFFVLSGFLITAILFENRANEASPGVPRSALLKNFYVRRILRIFPIYYIFIFTVFLVAKYVQTNITLDFIYYFTYTCNFIFYKEGYWDGMLTPLWSLAVEEQFYLLWPFIILFIKKKHLLPVIIVFIITGVVSGWMFRNTELGGVLPFTCFDCFGMGALLAWVIKFAPGRLQRFYSGLSVIAAVALLLFIYSLLKPQLVIIPLRTLIGCMALWLITFVVLNRHSGSLVFKYFFNNKILIFLGKISYGLYLYHTAVPYLLNSKLINIYLNPLLPDIIFKKYWGQLFLLENILLLVLVSWLSYILIEKRFLKLKSKFEYHSHH